MKRVILTLALVLLSGNRLAFGHGVPIDVSVDGSNRLVAAHEVYESEFAGSARTTSLPGVGVATQTQGMLGGEQIGLKVVQELLYFNGSSLATTTSILLVENPALSDFREVTQSTGALSPLFWNTYDGNTGWHSHGNYQVKPQSVPGTADTGFYGLVLQLTSPDGKHETSKPFLVVFNNNSTASIDAAITAFQSVMVPEPSSIALGVIGGSALLLAGLKRRRAKCSA